MFTKVLILAVTIVAVTCEDHYRLNHVHQAPKQYRYRPHHEHIPLRAYHEAQTGEEHYKVPESHGHAFSSQSIVHHGQAAAYEESQETNTEHVAPVYQYVDENSQEQQAHAVPVQHQYQSAHYPASLQHEVPVVQVPHNVPLHYQPESHEGLAYHHQVPHNAPQHEIPVHHQEVPVHHHEVPVHHHEVPVHHVAESHESHDEPIDYYAYPKYQYEYKVEDPHTGDNKFQHEYRDGDVVKGIYGLQEADGSLRTVEYSSDKHTGFSAIVKHSAPGQHVQIESHHQN